MLFNDLEVKTSVSITHLSLSELVLYRDKTICPETQNNVCFNVLAVDCAAIPAVPWQDQNRRHRNYLRRKFSKAAIRCALLINRPKIPAS